MRAPLTSLTIICIAFHHTIERGRPLSVNWPIPEPLRRMPRYKHVSLLRTTGTTKSMLSWVEHGLATHILVVKSSSSIGLCLFRITTFWGYGTADHYAKGQRV